MQSQKKKSRKIKGSTKRATINFGLEGKISYVKNTNKVLGFSRAELLWKKFSAFLVPPYDSLFHPSSLDKFFQTEAQFEKGAQTNNNAGASTSQWPLTCSNENLPFNPLSDDDLSYLQMHMPFGPDVPTDLLTSMQNLEYLAPSILPSSNSHKRKHDPADDDHLAQPVLKRAILECVGKRGEHIPLSVSFLKTTKGGALRESEFSCSLERLDSETLITIKDNGIIIYCDDKFPAIFGSECSKAVGTNLCNLIPTYSKHSLQIQIKKSTQFKTNFIGYTFDHQRMFLRVEGSQTTAREFTLWSLKISKIDCLMDAMLGIDEAGTITSVSGFCELLLGYQPSQLSGKNIQDLIQTVPTSVAPCDQPAIPESVSGSQIISITGSATNAATGHMNKPFSLTEASKADDSINSDPNSPQGSVSSPKMAVSLSVLNLNTDLFILLQDGWWVPVSTRLIPVTENSSTAYYVQVNRASMDEFWEHPSEAIGNYYFVSQLGKGSSSNVWLGMRKTDFKLCAVKTLKPAKDTNHIHDEAAILQTLHHPNIVQFIEVMQVNDATHIVMEHIDGVDLMTLVSQSKGLPESLARAIFMQVLSALHYCHFEAKIVHRDLKPQNIIVDKLGRVKLIDFGFAHKIEDGAKIRCLCGTPAYAPPCLLTGKCFYGPEIDMWALGILLYTMVTTKLPFRDVQQVLEGAFEEPAVSPECLDLLHCLLARDVNKRATYEKVIEHPWLSRPKRNS